MEQYYNEETIIVSWYGDVVTVMDIADDEAFFHVSNRRNW